MTTTPILEGRALSVRHGGVVALDHVDLALAPGRALGLIGPNGAGKTTCLDVLSGFTRPDHGTVLLDGVPIDRLPPHRRARAGVVRTFQGLELFGDLTAWEHVALAAGAGGRSPGPEEVLEQLGLAAVAGRVPPQLSNGERHRLALARAFALGPRVLMLDEPTAGLDRRELEGLIALVRRSVRDGLAVLVVDHDVGLVRACCEELQVLDLGRTIGRGPTDSVVRDPQVVAAYLGSPA